jgi:protease-4
MRKHPVISGIGILLAIGVVFFVLVYLMGVLIKGDRLLRQQAKVGVVRIEGVIADSKEIVEQLDEIDENPDVKAVVLRIDSPGGGVAASQEIYQAVRKLQPQRKIVVSMGSIAASGGYMIATVADRIVANPGTITGSISAVMHFADVQELMKKIGVRSSVVKSGKFKDIGSPVRDMTPEERQLLQGIVDDIYDQFVRGIARDRKLSLEKVKSIADGRIFSGRQALELKLVDELGGLQDAIAVAGRLAGIEGKPQILFTEKRKMGLWRYLLENAAETLKSEIGKSAGYPRGAQYLF